MVSIGIALLFADLTAVNPDCGAMANKSLIDKTKSFVVKTSDLNFSSESLRDTNAACVRVGFSISADGKPEHISILETSGDLALDRAAVAALKGYCFKQATSAGEAFMLVFKPHGLAK